jgi:uncharacterized protein YhdP
VGATRAEPAAALPAGARRTAASVAAQLRGALLVLGGALALCTVWLVAYQAAAARVPQHRAALEELIRRQTGLEIRFTGLAVRWGWYGPEALFQEVELGEPNARSPLLRAPRLIVGLDAWRTLRSGHLEARRITLEAPSIDLAGESPRPSRAAARSAADLRRPEAYGLERWSGGEIYLSGGTLRILLPGCTDADTFGISRAELRRVGAEWSAAAQLVLPPRLGADAHVSLQMHAKPDLSEISSATFAFEGRRLEVAAWAELAAMTQRGSLPNSGSGDFQLRAAFERGRLRAASGYIAAEALAWPATGTSDPQLAFDQLRSGWRLTPRGGAWRLSLDALELSLPARVPISGGAPVSVSTHAPSTAHSVVVDFTPDGRELSARAQDAPIAPLVSLAHWYVPRMAANGLAIEGEARELSFDWNARRPPGARLIGSAELRGLEFSDDSAGLALSGVSGHASLNESSLVFTLRARAARFALREAPAALEGLGINAHLTGTARPGGGWQLETQDLEVHRQGLSLRASGAVGSTADGSSPLIDAHLWMKDCDLALLASALGPHALPALGPAAAALRSGRMERAELNWRGRLDETPWRVPGGGFAGSLVLRDAALRESESWPEASELSAQIEWRGAHFQAAIDHGRAEGFILTDGLADWDARADRAAHLSGRLAGEVQQLITWLQSHPQAAAWTPGLEGLDLHGSTVLDLEVALPPASAGLPRPVEPRVRAAALLDGVQLRPVPGLPALEALRGTLAFTGGHLQRSTLTARWLGGPATLSVAERRDHGLTVLAVSGRGVMDVGEAVQIAAGPGKDKAVSGTADWSAMLTVVPDAGGPRWQLHADSSLTGLASRLPEPFAKSSAIALPLHLDWETSSGAAQLHLALGDRLAAVAALTRSADTWRIDRGAVRLGGGAPVLPVEPTLLLDGNVGRLDLAACLALWRQASQDAALPPLHAHLAVNELRAGSQRFPQATLTAQSAEGGGALSLQSAGLSGHARWAAVIDTEHPALVHLARFNLAQLSDTQLAAELAAVLSPAAQLSVEELQWQGRTLGSVSAKLAARGPELEASELALSGAAGEGRATVHCLEESCNLSFTLDSDDAAAVLAAFGFAPELSARYAHLDGQLRWSPEVSAPLATLGGSLHMRLDEGAMTPTADGMGLPFPLLSVPALLTGMHPGSGESPPPALRFARFTADYELLDGEARTSGLHFDGDAEILVRGRIGLSSGDYDQQAWILRGEDRLPAALRRLSPSPRVAALWLSLRDLLGGDGAGRARAALHLQGRWSDPIVTPLE